MTIRGSACRFNFVSKKHTCYIGGPAVMEDREKEI